MGASAGGGSRNAFGVAFQAEGRQWTKALCEQDSDGDGQSNGLELGDPNCDWTLGATPARAVDISHPGFRDSTTLAFVDSPISEPTSAPPIAPTPGLIDSTTSAVGAVPTQPTPAPTSESTAAPTPVQEAPAVPTPEPSPTPLPSSPVPTP